MKQRKHGKHSAQTQVNYISTEVSGSTLPLGHLEPGVLVWAGRGDMTAVHSPPATSLKK